MNRRYSPGINPEFLTGLTENWPLVDLVSMGYRGIELTPNGIERKPSLGEYFDLGLGVPCVNALSVLTPYLSGNLSDAVEWRRRRTLNGLTRILGLMGNRIPFLVVAPGRLAENYQTDEEARELLISSIVELAEQGLASILLESAPYRLFSSSSEISDIIDEVNMENVGAALDVGHVMIAGEDPLDAAMTLGERLEYVQIRDVDLTTGRHALDRHLPLGLGSVNEEQLVNLVQGVRWSMNICSPKSPLEAAGSALEIMGY